ncbi:MAG: general stress protein [Carnobacterium sp.]|uniref:general stress protein n=1 Tax=Carnobacterium sp. TaxID=48221 RepID=UPI00331576BF
MNKVVIGSFSNVQETTACVEQLIAEGHSTDSIKIVTTNQDPAAIQSQTSVEIDKVSAEEKESFLDKFKHLFADTDEDLVLENFGVDEASAEQYNESLKKGEYIVLADKDKEANSKTNLTKETTGTVGQAGQGVREVRNASQPTDEVNYANDGNDLLNNAEVPFNSQFTDQDELDESIIVKSDLTDTTVPETIEEDEIMADSIRQENKPRLQDNQDNESTNGAFSKDQDRRDDTRDVVSPKEEPLSRREFDPNDNPLQGEPTEDALKHEDQFESGSSNEESVDLPIFDNSTLSNQPISDPRDEFRK